MRPISLTVNSRGLSTRLQRMGLPRCRYGAQAQVRGKLARDAHETRLRWPGRPTQHHSPRACPLIATIYTRIARPNESIPGQVKAHARMNLSLITRGLLLATKDELAAERAPARPASTNGRSCHAKDGRVHSRAHTQIELAVHTAGIRAPND